MVRTKLYLATTGLPGLLLGLSNLGLKRKNFIAFQVKLELQLNLKGSNLNAKPSVIFACGPETRSNIRKSKCNYLSPWE